MRESYRDLGLAKFFSWIKELRTDTQKSAVVHVLKKGQISTGSSGGIRADQKLEQRS